MSRFSGPLILLLLGLAHAYQDEEFQEQDGEDGEDVVDISTIILTVNNGSKELLLEGDMLVPRTRNALKCWQKSCLWRRGADGYVRVPYVVSREFSEQEKRMIERAMRSFHGSTCVRFVPRGNEFDYISVENREGCFSALGRQRGRQVVSIKRRGCLYHGIIQHELLHALGFYHEQTRSDRDGFVRINWGNVEPAMAHNFHKQDTDNLNTPYDYTSVMHYGRTAFSVNGRDTITPIPDAGIQIGQRRGMSAWDIKRINILYGC
uniref:Metalloendopeptidase n=1 Tax=Syngnathoides biaculeatus TaxID=300417 RepID=A0A0U5CAZ5_9TELE|nr:hatching enzyme [Syngnathoides biaculeatus]